MFGPAVGKLVDIYGCRKVIPPFSILAVFAVCMLSLCKEYWQVILAQGVVFGLAAAELSLPALATATQWFSSKKGLAVGIVASGSSLGKKCPIESLEITKYHIGGIIYPCMLPRLIQEVGFPSAVRWTALLQGVLLLFANLLCSSPFPPLAKQPVTEKNNPSGGIRGFKSWPWGFFRDRLLLHYVGIVRSAELPSRDGFDARHERFCPVQSSNSKCRLVSRSNCPWMGERQNRRLQRNVSCYFTARNLNACFLVAVGIQPFTSGNYCFRPTIWLC